jgi:hypothetical protein
MASRALSHSEFCSAVRATYVSRKRGVQFSTKLQRKGQAFFPVDIHAFYSLVAKKYRKGRIARFKSLFRAGSVVDFGGSAWLWNQIGDGYEVTLLNNLRGTDAGKYQMVVGDACRAPFASQCCDIAFSNSVIEHVGDWEAQSSFAVEMQRIGRVVFCQTPNRWFPIDPHSLTPFLHWLPQKLQSPRLFRIFGIRFWFAHTREELEPAQMLSKRKMQKLFPDCQIITEYSFGLPKSFIALSHSATSVIVGEKSR